MSASHIRTTCLATALLSLISLDATALTGTASRPQLTSSEAGTYTISKALAKAGPITALVTDNWNPIAGVALLIADFAVAADGSTHYRTVQSAIDAAVAAGGSTRRYISVKAGTYTELVCVPSGAPPLTLFAWQRHDRHRHPLQQRQPHAQANRHRKSPLRQQCVSRHSGHFQ